ncbi:MAG: TraB/GumN family protein [Pseudomonadota bacterium]
MNQRQSASITWLSVAGLCLTHMLGATALAEPETNPAREALLWRVSDGEHHLLLLGSIHVLREKDMPLPPPVLDAYANSDTLVMEMDVASAPAGALERKLQEFGAAAPLRTLDVVFADGYPQLREQLLEAGIDPQAVNGFDPWFLATVLININLTQLGFRGNLGVEAQLSARATKDGRETAGLETISEQLSIFEGLATPTQRAMLSEALEELGQLRDITERTISAWRRADTQVLREELLDSLGDQPDLYRSLVADRNARWIPSLMAMLESPEVELVVVGSLHLLGEDSVVQLLRRKGGLTLEPLW